MGRTNDSFHSFERSHGLWGKEKKADKPPSFEFVNNLPPYVAFPFDYKRNRKMPILFGSNYKFKLHIYVENSSQDEAGQEELQREIDAAMWGWINLADLAHERAEAVEACTVLNSHHRQK